MNKNRFLALAMAGAMTLAAATSVFAAQSSADGEATGTTEVNLTVAETTYELVVPATLSVGGSGYNAFTEGVTVKGLANGEGVTSIDVTATSTNDWNLKGSDENKISYKLVAEGAPDTERTTYSFTDTTAMKEANGSTVACGVNVSDYSSVAAGNYSDTITWTAEVKKTTTTDVTLCNGDSYQWWSESYNHTYNAGSITVDGVTYAYDEYNYAGKGFKDGAFSTHSGKIKKIVITASYTIGAAAAEGWTESNKDGRYIATWENGEAESVDFTGQLYSNITIIVTVER